MAQSILDEPKQVGYNNQFHLIHHTIGRFCKVHFIVFSIPKNSNSDKNILITIEKYSDNNRKGSLLCTAVILTTVTLVGGKKYLIWPFVICDIEEPPKIMVC